MRSKAGTLAGGRGLPGGPSAGSGDRGRHPLPVPEPGQAADRTRALSRGGVSPGRLRRGRLGRRIEGARPTRATKAEVDVELELASGEGEAGSRQTISNVPNAILEAEITLRAFLQQGSCEIKLDQAIDAHCLNQIAAAAPSHERGAPGKT